jgi:hypothetical protein
MTNIRTILSKIWNQDSFNYIARIDGKTDARRFEMWLMENHYDLNMDNYEYDNKYDLLEELYGMYSWGHTNYVDYVLFFNDNICDHADFQRISRILKLKDLV